jgi:protein gp37
MGVSVENQANVIRAERLVRWVPSIVRFLSVEPMLGQVDLRKLLTTRPEEKDLFNIDWVIAGGESGPGARACELEWLRDLRDQCARAGVPFFLKQLGGFPNKRGHDEAVLDGRLWREMPGVVA